MHANRCIRVIKLWRLKPGFGRILSFNAGKCAKKVHLFKPCTLAAFESKFDHANRILCLKSVHASLDNVKVKSKCPG